jgi:TonB-dependent receptor
MKQIKRLFITMLLFTSALFAGNGELTVLVFKDGAPVANAEVSVDGSAAFMTDKDGEAYIVTPEGPHNVMIVIKENGQPLGVAKKSVTVVSDKNTQVIVTLTSTGSVSGIDVESPEAAAMAEAAPVDAAELKTGTLMAQILSSETSQPIANARVFVRGSTIDVTTDENGNFSIDLPEGQRTLSIIHTEYSSQTMNVTIVADETLSKLYSLTPASVEMEEFVVLAPHIEGSVAAIMDEKRNSEAVADVIGSEQFSKQGDSDAAGALKRVTGITIIDGKYVYVRGLGERYSNTLLNGLHLPSPEPTKRVVPLDMFPTSVIDSIMIQKTYSPDLPGTFGGGTIKIRTKGIPDEGFVKLGVDFKYKDGVTGEDGLTYEGGANDELGFDDGSRELPSSLLAASENFGEVSALTTAEITALGVDVANSRNLGAQTQVLYPGMKTSLSFGDKFEVTDDVDLGYLFAYSYTGENDIKNYSKVSYKWSNGVSDGSISSGGDNSLTSYHYQHSALLNVQSDLYDDHTLKYTMLYLHDTVDYAKTSTYHSNSADLDFFNTYFSWVERELIMNQFNGEHVLDNSGAYKFLWGFELGEASRYEPGTIEYDYEWDTTLLRYELSTSVSSPVKYSNNELNDELTNYMAAFRGDAEIFPAFEGKDFNDYYEIGLEKMVKDRSLESRIYSFATGPTNDRDNDVIGHIDTLISAQTVTDREWVLGNRYLPGDFYDAEQVIDAYYLKYHAQPIKEFEIMVGARQENSTQELTSYSKVGSDVVTTVYELVSDELLPSMVLTYKPIEEFQLRGGYSNTISRPDFREFSNNSYQDPESGEKVYGNPDLTYTTLTNIDLRGEYYFSPTESASVALFYKSFDKPIETVKIEAGRPARTFANADEATLFGTEFDFRKSLNTISENLSDYYVAGNIAFIDSTVTVNPDNKILYNMTSDDRPLQGQSPYVVNLTFSYDNPEIGRSVNLVYNTFGERIRALGTDAAPDEYEQPYDQLDLVWLEKIYGIDFKFKVKNLLDAEVVWSQDGHVTYSYKKGQEFSLGMSYKY